MKNSFGGKRKFIIEPFRGSNLFAVLIFDKDKGTMKYYDRENPKVEINDRLFESYNSELIKSIVAQAEIICRCTNRILWSY